MPPGVKIFDRLKIFYIFHFVNIILILQLGLDAGEIGVITPLRQQQNLIREKLLRDQCASQSLNHTVYEGRGGHVATLCSHGDGSSSSWSSSGVEVNTVDKYQGRDKECIVVSCTRSNSKGNVSG